MVNFYKIEVFAGKLFTKNKPPNIIRIATHEKFQTGGDFIELIHAIAILLLGFAAVLTDVTVHKIPNVILVLWIIQEVIIKGLEKIPISKCFLVTHIFFLILVIFILVPFYRIGTLGAGDVKLIILVAASLKNELEFVLLTFAVATVISVAKMIVRGEAAKRMKTLYEYFGPKGLWKKKTGYYEDESTKNRLKSSIHFSIPIFIATLPMVLKEVGLW